MTKIELFEHMDFNNGGTENDKNGLRITTTVSIPDFRLILIDGSRITGISQGRPIPPGTIVDLNDKLSSYRNSGPASATLYQDVEYRSPAGGKTLDIAPKSSNHDLRGGGWGGTYPNSENDTYSSLEIEGAPGDPLEGCPKVAEVIVIPGSIPIGGAGILKILMDRPAPRQGCEVGIGYESDGEWDSVVPLPTSFFLPHGVNRPPDFHFVVHLRDPRATYFEFKTFTRRSPGPSVRFRIP